MVCALKLMNRTPIKPMAASLPQTSSVFNPGEPLGIFRMKTYFNIFYVSFLLLGSAGFLQAATGTANQPAPGQTINVPAPTPFAEISRDANSKIWERTVYEALANGQIVAKKHRYTELATGLHYLSNGQWLESKETIESYPAGAVARQGQYQVIFANNLNSAGAISLQTPDGKNLRSNIMGLMYEDTATGDAVLVAQLQDSTGQLISANQVLYQNAFDGIKADVRYQYKKGSFEQDVILREQPPAPELFGMNPATTEIEVMTEFIDPPLETIKENTSRTHPEPDDDVSWGMMRLGHGRAFDLNAGQSPQTGVFVNRRYVTVQGVKVLLESVPFPRIQSQLQKLPRQASIQTPRPTMAFNDLVLPPSPPAKISAGPMRLASVEQAKGFVLDYVLIDGDPGDFTFEADTTYLIAGGYDVYGNLSFEGGTVIKYTTDPDNPGILEMWGTLTCDTAPGRPAVFTSINDDSVGDPISDPDLPLYYYNCALCGSASAGLAWHDIQIKYARYGMAIGYADTQINDSQFVNCLYPVWPQWMNLTLENVLIANADAPLLNIDAAVIANHVTVYGCANLTHDYFGWSGDTLTLTNSLLVDVSSDGDATITSDHSVETTDGGGPVFQAVGGGSYYLANGSPYRNAGTTNIDPTLLADLTKKTTYPPVVYTSTTISTPTTFSPQAQRDTDTPDLGYHYDALDYVFSGVEAQSNVTFTAGTAVGWYDLTWAAGYGIKVDDGAMIAFNGTATAPCWLARYDMSQESGNGNWTTVGWGFAITSNGGDSDYTSDAPQMTAQFTKFSSRNFNDSVFRDYNGFLVVRANDCEFWEPGEGGYSISTTYSNCLFFRTPPYVNDTGHTGCSFTMVNCTLEGGVLNSLYIQHHAGATWPAIIYNCAFDGTTNTVDTNGLVCDYNSYLTNADQLPVSGVHDVVLTSGYNWQSSWLGNYYLPGGSPLIDMGSTNANLLGLYHFTTQTNQTVEGTSQVDIGYHYVATDAYGNPLDTDGDGIPDYIEDANGNGLVDTGRDRLAKCHGFWFESVDHPAQTKFDLALTDKDQRKEIP